MIVYVVLSILLILWSCFEWRFKSDNTKASFFIFIIPIVHILIIPYVLLNYKYISSKRILRIYMPLFIMVVSLVMSLFFIYNCNSKYMTLKDVTYKDLLSAELVTNENVGNDYIDNFTLGKIKYQSDKIIRLFHEKEPNIEENFYFKKYNSYNQILVFNLNSFEESLDMYKIIFGNNPIGSGYDNKLFFNKLYYEYYPNSSDLFVQMFCEENKLVFWFSENEVSAENIKKDLQLLIKEKRKATSN